MRPGADDHGRLVAFAPLGLSGRRYLDEVMLALLSSLLVLCHT
jgi:hypothetical protein